MSQELTDKELRARLPEAVFHSNIHGSCFDDDQMIAFAREIAALAESPQAPAGPSSAHPVVTSLVPSGIPPSTTGA